MQLGLSNTIKANKVEQLERNIYSSAVGIWDINRSRLRLRRDSDEAEAEFEPILGKYLDTVSILAWSGADSVYITKIFDKTGNGNHAIQTVASSQPRLVNIGTFEVMDDESYGMYFDGINDYMKITDNNGLNITDALSFLISLQPSAQNGYVISRNSNSFVTSQYGVYYNYTFIVGSENSANLVLDGDRKQLTALNSIMSNTKTVYVGTTDGVQKGYVNGVSSGINGNYATELTSRANIQIGARSDDAGGTTFSIFYAGHLEKIVIFNKALIQEQITLLNNRL